MRTKKHILSLIFFSLLAILSQGQTTTVTLQPAGSIGLDANIKSVASTTNYATEATIEASRDASNNRVRNAFQFDVSSIPTNAIISSAQLTLFGVAHSGTNTCYLRQNTASWSETSITWNTAVATTTIGQISLAQSSTSNQNYVLDVKSMLQSMVNIPQTNFGFTLIKQNEAVTGGLIFASSDNSTATLRPKLVINYSLPMDVKCYSIPSTSSISANGSLTVSIQNGVPPYTYLWSDGSTSKDLFNKLPGVYTLTVTDNLANQVKKISIIPAENSTLSFTISTDALSGKDAMVAIRDDGTLLYNNYKDNPLIEAIRGTASGWLKRQSLFEFDLSSLPNNAVVSSATLQLYGSGHNPLNRPNDSYLSVNSSAWDEPTATWNNHPGDDATVSAIYMSGTSSASQNLNLDVKTHVQRWVQYPATNFGWKLKLADEVTASYSILSYASSDNATSTLRPSLVLSVFIPTKPSIASATITNVTPDIKGSINLNITGGQAPYSVAWNGVKLPSNRNYYVDYKNNFPSGIMDTIRIYNKLDSLRASPVFAGIESGIYNNKVYDANNDSVSFTTLVGNQISWLTSGITFTNSNILSTKNNSFTVFYGNGNQLTQSVPGSTTSYAVTNEVFNASEREVFVSFAVTNTTSVMDIGFKTASSTNTFAVTDMASNAYIHIAALGTMSMYFNNTLVGSSTYSTGDVMGILLDPYSQKVEFYKNAQKLNSTSVGASQILNKQLQLKLALTTAGMIVKDIVIAGPKFNIRQISATISDVTCSSLNSGIINFNAYSIADDMCSYSVSGPNGYTNSGTLLANNVLNGLEAGVYNITIPLYSYVNGNTCAGAINAYMTKSFTIACMPDWINQAPSGSTNVDIIDRSFNITANQSSPYTWLAGASSYNQLNTPDAGWAEFKPLLNTSFFYNGALDFGFNSIDLGTHPSDNDHFFYVKRIIPWATYGIGSSGFSTYYGGPYLASMSSNGTAIGIPFYTSSSDVLRINKVPISSGSQMKFEFYKNNAATPIVTSGIYTASNLVADISVNQTGIYIKKPRLSFMCPYNVQYALLKKKLDGGYYTTPNKTLYFKYDEEYNDNDGKLNFTIYNASNVAVLNSTSMGLSNVVSYGDNRYSINLANSAYYISGQTVSPNNFYILEVTNEKTEKWYLRFKMSN